MKWLLKNDLVIIKTGLLKGKIAKVCSIDWCKGLVVLDDVSGYKRHLKPGKDPKNPNGGVIVKKRKIALGNVALIHPESKKVVSYGVVLNKNGFRERSFSI